MKNFEAVKQLLDNSTTFYLISVTMDSTYGYLNSYYRKLFEPQHGDLIGKHYAITMHTDDLAICAAVSAKCFAFPDQVFPATIRKHDGNGGYIATQWDYKAMFDENGNPSGVFCIGYDITTFMQKAVALEQMQHLQSHVIRKPIANLLGLIGLVDHNTLPAGTQEVLKLIQNAVSELDQFTQSTHKN